MALVAVRTTAAVRADVAHARSPTEPSSDDAQAFFAGRLLVASPQIEEETFRRSVVLLLHHDEEGAQGVILNRPIEADIDAVLPGW